MASILKSPKLVIILRKDLAMSVGKVGAQVGHAVQKALFAYAQPNPISRSMVVTLSDAAYEWLHNGEFKKIILAGSSEQHLIDLYVAANAAKLNTRLVTDNGLTEFDGVKTLTCLAIGPDYPDKIDPITRSLRRYT